MKTPPFISKLQSFTVIVSISEDCCRPLLKTDNIEAKRGIDFSKTGLQLQIILLFVMSFTKQCIHFHL